MSDTKTVYYLSYVDFEKHTAVMLSKKYLPDTRVEVLYETGFGYDQVQTSASDVSLLSRHKGIISNYSYLERFSFHPDYQVGIKTFEISEAEFALLNAKLKIRAAQIESDIIKYQKIGIFGLNFNCKSYITSLLSELGIVEAASLRNTVIQVPGTVDKNLQQVSMSNFLCPAKDGKDKKKRQLIDRATPMLQRCEQHLHKLSNAFVNRKTTAANIKAYEDYQYILERVIQHFNLTKEYTANLLKNDDVSINELVFYLKANDKDLNTFTSLLSDIIVLSKELTATSDFKADLDKTLLDMKQLHRDMEGLYQDALAIKNCKVTYEWNPENPPNISERLNLDIFTNNEKAIYLTNRNVIEMTDGFESIVTLLSALKDADCKDDVNVLKAFIESAKKEVVASEVTFQKRVGISDDNDVIDECLKQQKEMNAIMSRLREKLSAYQPKSPQKINLIMELIFNLLDRINSNMLFTHRPIKNTLVRQLDVVEKKMFKGKHHKHKQLLFATVSKPNQTKPSHAHHSHVNHTTTGKRK